MSKTTDTKASATQSYKAVWRAPSGDIPVTVIGDLGVQADGCHYLKIAESPTGVLADEIYRPDKLRIEAALDYMSKSWTPVPIPLKEKGPVLKAWQKYQPQNGQIQRDFDGVGNIGLILGKPSNGLVDVDLDCPEARWLASKFLPTTEMKSGRDGAQASHWWFRSAIAKTKQFEDPNIKKGNDRATVLELRSTGGQTVVPPSIHPSGESYQWSGALNPAEVDPDALTKAVGRLAACALVARYWPNATRHNAALALAGVLLRNGWTLAEARSFILSAAHVANDDELDDRARAIIDTDEKLKAGENVTGIPKFVEIFGKPTADKIIKWLELRPVAREQTQAQTEGTPVEDPQGTGQPRAVIAHNQVLAEILKVLKPLDFRNEAKLEADDKLNQKHYCVIASQEIVKTAKSLNCGLCKNLDFIYVYNGQYWKQIEADEMGKFLGEAAEKLGVDEITARWFKFREAMYKQFLTTAYLPKPERKQGVTLINLSNGTFEINGGAPHLREFRREDFLTYQLPFDYDERATCPRWQKFLDEVLPDEAGRVEECDGIGNHYDAFKARQKILAEYIGQCFINDNSLKLEKVLMPYGSGANGKGVFFEVITALLGAENISHYGLSELAHEYYRGMIADKLLNYGSEVSTQIDAETFKKLASHEPVTGRLPYGRPFTMSDYARLAFNCNELPRDVEHTHAYFRRFMIVPFNITITNPDPELASKIIASELPGVFNWVLDGLKRLLQQKKFTTCKMVDEALETYKRESDSVSLFLADDGWQKDPNTLTPLSELYRDFKEYCCDNGHLRMGKQKFAKRLESNGIARIDTNKPHFQLSKSG